MANVRPPLSDIPEEHDVDLDLFSDSFLDGPLKHGSIEDLHNRATKPPPNDHSGRPETPKEQSVLSASVTPQTQAFLNMRDFPQDDIDNEPPKLLTFQQSLPVANVITGFRFDRAPEKKSLYKQSKENQNGAGDKLGKTPRTTSHPS